MTQAERERLFQERMDRKKENKEIQDAQVAEELRQQYLKRTGRKELKP